MTNITSASDEYPSSAPPSRPIPITANRARKPPRSAVTCLTAASYAARIVVSATLLSPRAMFVTEIRPSMSPQASRSISCRLADRAASTASLADPARRARASSAVATVSGSGASSASSSTSSRSTSGARVSRLATNRDGFGGSSAPK